MSVGKGAASSCSATIARVGRNGDGVCVFGEVGYEVAVAFYIKCISGVGGNDIAILGPIGESVACIGRGSDRAALSVGKGAATSCSATIARVGRNGDGVCVFGEVGYEVAVAFHIKSISGVGGNDIAVFGPIGEGIARVGRGRNRAGLALVVGAAAGNCSCVGGVGSHCDGIGIRSNGNRLDVTAYHGIVGGDQANAITTPRRHIGDLCGDASAVIGGDAT